jgi:hypothetical protein
MKRNWRGAAKPAKPMTSQAQTAISRVSMGSRVSSFHG